MSDNRDIYEKEEEVDRYLREQGYTLEDLAADEETADTSGSYNKSVRRIFFPSTFSAAVYKEFENEDTCSECGRRCTGSERTLDHITPVSQYFNDTGYKVVPEERARWYNDVNNLQVLCKKCNSRKGGKRFNLKKVAKCMANGKAGVFTIK